MERQNSVAHPLDESRLDTSSLSNEIGRFPVPPWRDRLDPPSFQFSQLGEPHANRFDPRRNYIGGSGLANDHPIELSGYQEVEMDHSGLHSNELK